MKKSGPMAVGAAACIFILVLAASMLLDGCAGGSADLGAPYTAEGSGITPGQLPNPNPNLTTPPTVPANSVQWVRRPQPEYPVEARQRKEQGTVIVRALVNTQGVPAAVSVFRSSGYPDLDVAAQRAIWNARFTPYMRNGAPIAVYVQSPIIFLLNN
jgi:TonB family protein